jgi:hypothetical protein
MAELTENGRYAGIDLTPTQSMVAEADASLSLIQEHGRTGSAVSIARARDIRAGRRLSPETVRRMVSFFTRHESHKLLEGWNKGESGFPSDSRIAWGLWGGDSGFAWAMRKVAELDAADDLIVVHSVEYETEDPGLVANRLDRRMMDGREWAVAPAVALVAGVVNGQLITPEELAKYPEAWSGRPVPLRHPKDKNGDPVSANSPSVIPAQVLGAFFNPTIDGDRLKGEIWLDVAKVQALGGDALSTLQRLDQGGSVEVSTAYFCDLEPGMGAVNGKEYTGIQRNLRPDHLALLPDEIGACSWRDGCGTPRVNVLHVNSCNCQTEDVMANQDVQDPTLDPEAEPTQAPAETVEDETPKTNAAGGGEDLSALMAMIREFGGVNSLRDTLLNLHDLSTLVQGLGGIEVVREALQAQAVAAQNAKAEIVSRLQANAACVFSEEDLQAMNLDHLRKLDQSLGGASRPADYSGRGMATNRSADVEWVVYQGPKAA